jgi:phage tail-like protein
MVRRLISKWVAPATAVVVTLGLVFAVNALRDPGRTSAQQAAGPVTAARFTLTTDSFGTFDFSALAGISSQVEPMQYLSSNPYTLEHTKQFGKTKPPSVVLKRTLSAGTIGLRLFQWHTLARSDSPNARTNATLTVTDSTGKAVESFQLERAWVSKIDISGTKVGASSAVTETVTIVADSLTIQ